MIPSEYNNVNNSEAEKNLYYKLNEVFDDSWIIFHSYDFESRNRENKLIEAEIDFLLLNKEFGLLVLEVKGGQIKYKDGIWYQNNKLIKDPFKQAKTNKYSIKKHLSDYLKDEPPIAIGYAVCFPDHFGAEENLLRGQGDNVFTGENINYISELIIDLMKDFKGPGYKIDQKMFRTLGKALLPIFEYGTSLIDLFGQGARKVFSLTELQCELLIALSEKKRIVIKGCAGSGKTIMAVKKAKQLALEGKSVLLLCYNNLLAEKLAAETKDYPGIIAKTYHNFCGSELDKAGIKTENINSKQEFYQRELPEKFLNLIAEKPINFDAVIVDEGQDFLEQYWITIDELVRKDSYYYIFYDPDQNLFKSKIEIPNHDEPIILNKNCRNTKQIFSYLEKFSSMKIRIDKEAPEGKEVKILHSNDSQPRRKQLSQILHNLINNDNIKEERIVILGIHRLAHTSLGENNVVGKFKIVDNGPAALNSIAYYTCMKFKGLESDVVILLDYDNADWDNKKRYTAISRAKYLLYILDGPESI